MRCTDGVRPRLRLAVAVLALGLAGCAGQPRAPAAPAPAAVVSAPRPAATPLGSLIPPVKAEPTQGAQSTPSAGGARGGPPGATAPKPPPRYVKLGPPKTPRSWDELRLQAAQRLVAAHPDTSYVAQPPSILLAIPILEIELNADGTVRHIHVVRVPGQAQDTMQLAIDAVRRAAPFGDVSRLSKPWKFVETFLFDDERRFMPRTLDR